MGRLQILGACTTAIMKDLGQKENFYTSKWGEYSHVVRMQILFVILQSLVSTQLHWNTFTY